MPADGVAEGFRAFLVWGGPAALGLLATLVYERMSRRRARWPVLPLGLLKAGLLASLLAPYLHHLLQYHRWEKWIDVTVTTLLAWAVIRIVIHIVLEWPRSRQGAQPLPRITRDVLLLVCFSTVLLVVLRVYGNINLAGLLTTSAVLTVVIGLAAQTTLSSFFSGLTLQLERPFAIGEWIRIGEQEGVVHGITWKSTLLKTREEHLVYIPNTEIATSRFTNFSRPTRRVVATLPLGVEYGAAPNKVRRVLLGVLAQDARILPQPPPEVRLMAFGDFAITYEIRFAHRDVENEPRLKADLNHQLWYALRRNEIRIPFPIRDVHLAHEERKLLDGEEKAHREEALHLLANVPTLATLSPDEQQHLAENVRMQLFGKGEIVVRQDAEGDTLYIIRHGRCRVEVVRQGGGTQQLAELGPGEFFGEMTLLTGAVRSATVTAMEDASLLAVDKESMAMVLQANPAIAEELARVVADRDAHREDVLDAGSGQAPVPESETSRRLMKRIKSFFGVG